VRGRWLIPSKAEGTPPETFPEPPTRSVVPENTRGPGPKCQAMHFIDRPAGDRANASDRPSKAEGASGREPGIGSPSHPPIPLQLWLALDEVPPDLHRCKPPKPTRTHQSAAQLHHQAGSSAVLKASPTDLTFPTSAVRPPPDPHPYTDPRVTTSPSRPTSTAPGRDRAGWRAQCSGHPWAAHGPAYVAMVTRKQMNRRSEDATTCRRSATHDLHRRRHRRPVCACANRLAAAGKAVLPRGDRPCHQHARSGPVRSDRCSPPDVPPGNEGITVSPPRAQTPDDHRSVKHDQPFPTATPAPHRPTSPPPGHHLCDRLRQVHPQPGDRLPRPGPSPDASPTGPDQILQSPRSTSRLPAGSRPGTATSSRAARPVRRPR
jgi:hypothetical protein